MKKKDKLKGGLSITERMLEGLDGRRTKMLLGTPICISPHLIPIVMVDVYIFLHKFNDVLVQNRSHVDLWARWFKIKVVPKLD